jgi:hypothetical protein
MGVDNGGGMMVDKVECTWLDKSEVQCVPR